MRAILVILEWIPAIDAFFRKLQEAYIKAKVEIDDKEFIRAIETASKKKDVGDLRKSISKHLTK